MQYGVLGDFVKHDAARVFRLKFQHLVKVPGNSLPLAVLIGSEPHHLCLLCHLLKLGNKSLLVVGNLVFGSKTILHIDAEILFPEVAYVAVTRHYGEIGTKEFSDGFSFGRRLYYDKVFHHGWEYLGGIDIQNFGKITKNTGKNTLFNVIYQSYQQKHQSTGSIYATRFSAMQGRTAIWPKPCSPTHSANAWCLPAGFRGTRRRHRQHPAPPR